MRWGGTLSGPVVIPKVYDGRNRTFWSAGYEGMEVKRQQSNTATFPTLDERNGDLSKLLAVGTSYQIYDPRTAALNSAGRVVRTPFAGNLIPASRLDPIAQKILTYYPAPNTAGDATGTSNYVRAENQIWKYRSIATRVDHNISERWRVFGRYGASEFGQNTQAYPSVAFGGWTNPKGDRLGLDSVYTLSPTMLFAAKPIAEVAASAFNTNGGLFFPGVNGTSRSLWNGDRNNFMPRIGLAYQLTPKTVVRAGYGFFFAASGADYNDVNQTGYSLATSIIPSTDNGLTLLTSLANPFPSGILSPTGSSTGLATNVGRAISFYNQNLLDPYMQRWSFNVQRELPLRTVLEVGYVGNRGTKLVSTRNINAVPNQYLSSTGARDQARIDYLNQLVPNPFAGISSFTGTTLAAANIARSQLLRPYPAFSDITYNSNEGFSWYHGLTVNLEKRFSSGLLFQTNWTWSKFMEATSYLNGGDARPYRSISDQDSTNRYTMNVLYEIPVGRGKQLFGGMNRWLDLAVGGWQVQGSYEGQSGFPLGFGNMIFNGDLANIAIPVSERRAERWFNTAAGFETRSAYQLASNVRTAALRFSGVRGDGINNLDASLMKKFRVTEKLTGQFRLEGINAANHVQFADPNTTVTSTAFGTVTAERGHGQRQINFVFKLIY